MFDLFILYNIIDYMAINFWLTIWNLRGSILKKDIDIDNIEKNSACGICGEAFLIPKELEKEDYLPLGEKDDIHTGNAKLISNLSGKRCWYDVKIMKVNRIFSQKSKDFVVKITDERLLKKTGGLVQGMSGSPLVQDGKIIGALTHVFVNDPTKGYGIFIKEMLK